MEQRPTHRIDRQSAAPKRSLPAHFVGLILAIVAAPLAAQNREFIDDMGGNGLYSLSRSQDDIALWQDAQQDIRADRYPAAVARLHELMNGGTGGVVPDLAGREQFLGLQLAAIRTLRDLPAAGREAYDKLARREAGEVFDTDPRSLSPEQLHHLARSFPASSSGIRARILLGDLALERGDALVASREYRAALDATPLRDAQRSALLKRADAAESLAAHLLGAEAGSQSTRDQLSAVWYDDSSASGWPSYGGGYDGTRSMAAPVGAGRDAFYEQVQAPGFRENPFAMHAVGDLNGVFLNTGVSVVAIDPLTQEVRWVGEGAMSDRDLADDYAYNVDMVLAAATSGDVVVAPLQVPKEVVGARRAQSFQGRINIISRLPSRRLFAYHRRTGKRLWSHWDTKDGPLATKFDGHEACGPPLIAGDAVYVATHDQSGAITFRVAAYDLHSGELLWRRLICSSQQEVNMFGNARQEFAAGALAMHGGVLFGSTNLGVCFACDAQDGSIRWITGYDVIPLPATRLRNQDYRKVFFANNPIVIVDGVLATTPLDSTKAIGIDIETGARLWEIPYQGAGGQGNLSFRWLLGALGDEFIFSGLGILAVRARPEDVGGRRQPKMRLVASAESLGQTDYRLSGVPRGAVTRDHIYYIGSRGHLQILDAQANRSPKSKDFGPALAGNLLLTDGLAVLVNPGEVRVLADFSALVATAERKLKQNPEDPATILRLATLWRAQAGDRLASQFGERAEQLYAEGLEQAAARGLGTGSAVYRELSEGLFQLSLIRARQTLERNRAAGLELLLRARERALDDDTWMVAQRMVLDLVVESPERHLAELELAAGRCGSLEHDFGRVGRLPVAAYTMWRSLPVLAERDPEAAALRAQELIERFGELEAEGRSLRTTATEVLAGLIRTHGSAVYAQIEQRAQAALTAAGDDSGLLRSIGTRYPLSQAARLAAVRMIDVAVAAGDMTAAADSFRNATEAGPPAPGVLRRMMAAALAAGNRTLGFHLGERIVATGKDLRSDFPADAEQTLGKVVAQTFAAAEAQPPVATPVAPALPASLVTKLSTQDDATLRYVEVVDAPGFEVPTDRPLYLLRDVGPILAIPLDEGEPRLENRLFSIPIRQYTTKPLWSFGELVVLSEAKQLRAVHYRTGAEQWTFVAQSERELNIVGVSAGVLQVRSDIENTRGDGGVLLGIEPTSGAMLYRHQFPPFRDSIQPIWAPHGIEVLDPGSNEGEPAIERFDPITGRLVQRTPLQSSVLRFLRMDGEQKHRRRSAFVQRDFVSTEDRIFLFSDGVNDQRSRMVAIDRSGQQVASWEGRAGVTIKMVAIRGERLVVLQRSPGASWLDVLDHRLQRRTGIDSLGANAQATNWREEIHGTAAPARLLIQAGKRGGQIGYVDLDKGRPGTFNVPNIDGMLPWPYLGADFVVMPCARPNSRARIRVVNFAGRGALPGGKMELSLTLNRPLRLFPHGKHTILETNEGIFVLGE